MNGIRRVLAERKPNRKLLVPFFTAGFPDVKTTRELVMAAVSARADMIEIGIPFSDPLADGPAIQHSSHLALGNGITPQAILSLVQELKQQIDTPILLMGYYNPILAYGLRRFLLAARDAGVDGLIVPDLPTDEASAYVDLATRNDLSAVFLVAPTSPLPRVKEIDKRSTDFVYAVTVTGVTGTGKTFGSATDTYLKRLRTVLNKPFVAGFGVNSPEAAKQMVRHADGVVIGSALVERIRQSASGRQAVSSVERFLKDVRRVLS